MRTITSISPIIKKYETAGSLPVKIWGDDLEYYIGKYPRYDGDFRLVNEYLGNRFAGLWGIPVPEMVQGNPGYHSSATPGGCIAQDRQGSCPTPAPVLPNGGFGVAQYQGVRLRNTGGRGCPIQGVGVAQPRG
jgi:hypothetical protein